MANQAKGEVGFEVEGRPYKLVFSTNALCDLEDAAGLGINEIGEMLSAKRLRIKIVRAALWAGLQANHPELTLHDAGNLIGKMTAIAALTKITEAMQAAFPSQQDGKAQGNPQ